MKRLLLTVGAAVAAAAFTPLAGAGAGGSYDYVVGGGARATDDSSQIVNRFAVEAFDGPNGVSGLYNVHPENDPSASRRVDVKCTYIDGNRAVVGGVIVAAAPDLLGVGFAVAFEDNGSPHGGVTTDRVSSNDFFLEPGRTPPLTQADCAAEAASAGIFNTLHPMASGDVEIYDAP